MSKRIIVEVKGGAGSGNWGHTGRPGLVGGSGGKRAYPFVGAYDARLARAHNELPAIADDIASPSHPLVGLLASKMEFYRASSTWYYRNPKSVWLPDKWLRGDPTYQDQLTISYATRPE